MEELATRAGVEVEREKTSGGPQKPRKPVDSPLYALLAAASDYYRAALKTTLSVMLPLITSRSAASAGLLPAILL